MYLNEAVTAIEKNQTKQVLIDDTKPKVIFAGSKGHNLSKKLYKVFTSLQAEYPDIAFYSIDVKGNKLAVKLLGITKVPALIFVKGGAVAGVQQGFTKDTDVKTFLDTADANVATVGGVSSKMKPYFRILDKYVKNNPGMEDKIKNSPQDAKKELVQEILNVSDLDEKKATEVATSYINRKLGKPDVPVTKNEKAMAKYFDFLKQHLEENPIDDNTNAKEYIDNAFHALNTQFEKNKTQSLNILNAYAKEYKSEPLQKLISAYKEKPKPVEPTEPAKPEDTTTEEQKIENATQEYLDSHTGMLNNDDIVNDVATKLGVDKSTIKDTIIRYITNKATGLGEGKFTMKIKMNPISEDNANGYNSFTNRQTIRFMKQMDLLEDVKDSKGVRISVKDVISFRKDIRKYIVQKIVEPDKVVLLLDLDEKPQYTTIGSNWVEFVTHLAPGDLLITPDGEGKVVEVSDKGNTVDCEVAIGGTPKVKTFHVNEIEEYDEKVSNSTTKTTAKATQTAPETSEAPVEGEGEANPFESVSRSFKKKVRINLG